jgi:hypothetical protein
MPTVVSIHFQLILDCLCHSRRVPIRRIGDGVDNRDIFGEMRVMRVSDSTTPAVDVLFIDKRGAGKLGM